MSDQYTSERPICVYLLQLGDTRYYKIGISRNVASRILELQTATPFELRLVMAYEQVDAFRVERDLHSALQSFRVRNEWFCMEAGEILRVFQAFNAMAVIDRGLEDSDCTPEMMAYTLTPDEYAKPEPEPATSLEVLRAVRANGWTREQARANGLKFRDQMWADANKPV